MPRMIRVFSSILAIRRPALQSLPLLLVGGLWIASLTGCAAEPDSEARVYETRGVVVQLPSATQPGSEFFIDHEAIPSFVSIDGEVTGMDAMRMGFPLQDASMIEGLSIGDKVALSLQVDWDGSPPLLVTRLEKLPEDTVLDLANSAAASHDHGQDHAGHGEHEPGEGEPGESEPDGAVGEGDHGDGDHDRDGHGDAMEDPAPSAVDAQESDSQSSGSPASSGSGL